MSEKLDPTKITPTGREIIHMGLVEYRDSIFSPEEIE